MRFDDNVSFIASHAYESEKTSIGSSCSFRARCNTKSPLTRSDRVYDTLSNDSICIDIIPNEEKPRKHASTMAALRSQFFHSSLENKSATKGMDEKTIIEVSNETLNAPSAQGTLKDCNATVLVIESSKL